MYVWFFGWLERELNQARAPRRTARRFAAENQFAAERERQSLKGSNAEPSTAKKIEALVKEWIALLLRAMIWALALYLFVLQVSVVRGASMMPNFHDDERLLLDKVTFDFREPIRGEVIVFEAVTQEPQTKQLQRLDYIKRVIGMPGEVIAIHSGKVFVNGVPLQESYGPERFLYWEELAGPTTARTYVVPPGHYFVMGDRRWNSEDSRGDRIGFVSWHQIKGKVRCRFWPLEQWTWY